MGAFGTTSLAVVLVGSTDYTVRTINDEWTTNEIVILLMSTDNLVRTTNLTVVLAIDPQIIQ